MPILNLAMPTPLRRSFDYLPPPRLSTAEIQALQPGIRVSAPFGNRQLVGILLAVKDSSDLEHSKLKPASEVLDSSPLLPPELLALGQWAASYYQHPIGDALANTIPAPLRKGQPLLKTSRTRWRLSTEGKGLPCGALQRAAKQAQLLALLQQSHSVGEAELKACGTSKSIVKALLDKGLVESYESEQATTDSPVAAEQPLTLNPEQQLAVDCVNSNPGYHCYLLEGVTGSGKTEVYLQLIQSCLSRGQQSLLLLPEISLTPQTLSRFQQRFNCPIALLHSGLSDRERLLSWQRARSGEAAIIIGTRSAAFTPLANMGLVIVDEEHDSSFKQQDGFRYSARDIAIKRAAGQQCPILLGSATPSLESLNNALQGRYQHLQLNQRATGASPPRLELLDIRHAPMQDGLSPSLISAIGREIHAGNQVLVFINRRGFSPMLMCHDCGYVAQCNQCDARMTVHFQQHKLRCHHCDSTTALPRQCPDCHSAQLDFRGSGTERSEQALNQLFPDTEVIRIDRDTTSRKYAMQNLLDQVHSGQPCILVGTQMLAKGHHFPDVTLVAVLDADGGLFSADFRGPEKMGQLLVQVAGRAGRASKPGTVMIQTHQPEHPLITSLAHNSFHQYANQLLQERKTSGLPPYTHLALVRAEATSIELAENFLLNLRQQVEGNSQARLLGPLPAPMARRAGHYRAQLLLQADQRQQLHQCLQLLCQQAEQSPQGKKLRWSVDVDPVEMY